MADSIEGVNSILSRNANLRKKLADLLDGNPQTFQVNSPTPSAISPLHTASAHTSIDQLGAFDGSPSTTLRLSGADVVITANEVNSRHGTGVLVQKIFSGARNIFSIRAHNHYNGEHVLGDIGLLLSSKGLSRPDLYRLVLNAFGDSTAKRILCIPFDADEVRTAIAVKDVFDIPLCTYIMDDNSICSGKIPNELMKELLEKSSLRLAISPEMQHAYQQAHNLKFWILPPVVSDNLILRHRRPQKRDPNLGVLVGNVWGQRWLDLLRQTVRGTGISIHWYCNAGKKCSWLKLDPEELEADGIFLRDPLPEHELSPLLSTYGFALLPSGTLDAEDDNRSVAQLSLPSRVPFILATSHTPIIVLGSDKTASARFVRKFEVGTSSPYDPEHFKAAVKKIVEPSQQDVLSENAAKISKVFSDSGIAQWIWQALEDGYPEDQTFEALMAPDPEDVAYYVEPPSPSNIFWEFVPDYTAIRRLKKLGFSPDFVIDVGASTGIWSDAISRLFPNARFILVEPLLSKHDESSKNIFINSHPNFETVEAAMSNERGTVHFQVSSDLYGSSLLQPNDRNDYETVEVQVLTLDTLAKEREIKGKGFLKIDVQCAEHLVLEGGKAFLSQVDAVQLELSLVRLDERAKTFIEMVQLMEQQGFRYFDDVNHWRSAIDGRLIQKDALFLRKGFLE